MATPALATSPLPTPTNGTASTSWDWWSSLTFRSGTGIGDNRSPFAATPDGVPGIDGEDVKRQTSRVRLARGLFGFGQGGGADADGIGAGRDGKGRTEEEKLGQQTNSSGDEEGGESEAMVEPVDVDELLWEAQMAFVNHRDSKAENLLELAAEYGSSDACLNLANLSLKRLTSRPSPRLHQRDNTAVPSPHLSSHHDPQLHQHDNAAELAKGCRWLLRGLRLELDKAGRCQRPEGDSVEAPTANLEVVNDLIQTLASLYRYGKLKPPRELAQGSSRPDDFWDQGAAIAEEWISHPVVKLDIDAVGGETPHSPTSPTFDPQMRFRRSCYVHLCYLLALARFPFTSPPLASIPDESDSSPPVPLTAKSSGSLTGHWGHAQAQKFWSDIINVSSMPGGVGTRKGEAIVAKAKRRLGLLQEAGMANPQTPDGEASADSPLIQHGLHQSPESFEKAVPAASGLTLKLRIPSRQKSASTSDGPKSGAVQSTMTRHARFAADRQREPSPPAVQTPSADDVISADAQSTSKIDSAPRAGIAFPKLKDAAPSPESSNDLSLRSKPLRPRLRSTLSPDIFIGNRDRVQSLPATPPIPSRSSTPTTFLSIEHAGLHDSKGKGIVERDDSSFLSPADTRSTCSRRMRNDSFASLASLDAESVRSFATSLAAPASAPPGHRRRVAQSLRSLRSWRPQLSRLWKTSVSGDVDEQVRYTALAESLAQALQRDDDIRSAWTWEEIQAVGHASGDENVIVDEGEEVEAPQDSPATSRYSDATTAPSDSSKAPPSLTTAVTTAENSPELAKRPMLPQQSSSKPGKLFVTLPQHRHLSAPGTPRASRERRAVSGRNPQLTPLSPLTGSKQVKKQTSLVSVDGLGGSTDNLEGGKKGNKMDPLLAALEEQSRVNVKARCAVCGKSGINYPKCPKCDKTFCSRDCRVSVEGGGDGLRHVCRSREASPETTPSLA